MKATDNQLLMAAAYIARGLCACDDEDPCMTNERVAIISVDIAQKIAELIPEDEERDVLTDEKVGEVLPKYVTTHLGVSGSKLASLISTGEGMTSRKAYNIIYRGEFLGMIENVGTGNSKAVYVLSDKWGK